MFLGHRNQWHYNPQNVGSEGIGGFGLCSTGDVIYQFRENGKRGKVDEGNNTFNFDYV